MADGCSRSLFLDLAPMSVKTQVEAQEIPSLADHFVPIYRHHTAYLEFRAGVTQLRSFEIRRKRAEHNSAIFSAMASLEAEDSARRKCDRGLVCSLSRAGSARDARRSAAAALPSWQTSSLPYRDW